MENVHLKDNQEYLTEDEAKSLKELFRKNLKAYKEKDPSMSDEQWLEELFTSEIPGMDANDAKNDAIEITKTIESFDSSLKSCRQAATEGKSKEQWLSDKLQEASVGMSVEEYGRSLQQLDDLLYAKNLEMADALSRSADGHISMCSNLDGYIAEHMLAGTADLSASLQGKNISVRVLGSNDANSVDIQAINFHTGEIQNYQAKFGKDAPATIELFKRGDYEGQILIVPTEQLKEVQAYFHDKGSSVIVTDHIEAWGANGKAFTKEIMEELRDKAQQLNEAPKLDYSHYQTRDLAINIGKNAGVMALRTAAITTGINIAAKVFKGENIDKDELIETALSTGKDTVLKTVVAGTLEVATKRGLLRIIPKFITGNGFANIACIAVENVKIIKRVLSKDISLTKGLDEMAQVSVATIGGLSTMVVGAKIGASVVGWIPAIGPGLAVITGFVGGMVGYCAGSKIGEELYSTAKKMATAAKTLAKAAFDGIRRVGETIASGISNIGNSLAMVLGF